MEVNDDDHLTLYVKAGADGERLGACPFCQRALMVVTIKSMQHPFHFRLTSVNLSRPPTEFHRRGLRRVPALIDGDTIVDNIEDIVAYMEDKFADDTLEYNDSAADVAIKDVFSRFCFYIKQVSKDSTQLESQLQKLDAFLATKRSVFLCGDRLSHLDCEFLPKLQHIRVASANLKNFHIPVHFKHVWAYLFAAYNQEVFVDTCPSDQEILLHWIDRPQRGSHMAYNQHKRLIQETARYSFDVPAFASLVTLE